MAERQADGARRFHHVNGVFLDLLSLDPDVWARHPDGSDEFTGATNDGASAGGYTFPPFAMQH